VLHDPLAAAIEPSLEMVPTAASLDAVPAGICEDGRPWMVPVDGGSMVIGGIPKGGKSVTISAILAGLAGRPDVQIVAIDMKGMIELGIWEPRCSAAAGDQEKALEILREVDRIRRDRQEFVRNSGMTSLSRIGYSRGMPYILVVIDECAELFSAESAAKEAKERAAELIATTSRIVRLGRASGVGMLVATQRPTVDSLPGVIRDNAANKIATRCTTADQAKAVLGEIGGGVSPTQIGPGQPGVAVTDTGAGLVRVRSAFLSEDVRREVVRRTAHLARPLADLTVVGAR
jgi:S-DNA-T family DNA segregation ATPase FtsK/SpoIIIE